MCCATSYRLRDHICLFGQVLYDVKGILEKNRDTFRDDILNLLKDSRQDIWLPLKLDKDRNV